MVFPLAYLGYLGVAAAAAFLTSCNSEEKKSPEFTDPPISAEPPPPKAAPKLMVEEKEPAYAVYLKLEEAGINLEDMDRVAKRGEVTDEDLFYVGHNFYKFAHGSVQQNKEWAEKIQITFKETSDRYVGLGVGQNGMTYPGICGNLNMFKKATLFNYDHAEAQLILGVCEPDKTRLRHAIRLDPDFAKQNLERYSREATENKLDDPQRLSNLRDALAIAKGK